MRKNMRTFTEETETAYKEMAPRWNADHVDGHYLLRIE